MTEIKPCAHCGERMTAAVLCEECAGRSYPLTVLMDKALELIRDTEQEIPEPTRHEMYRFTRLEVKGVLR